MHERADLWDLWIGSEAEASNFTVLLALDPLLLLSSPCHHQKAI
jgi:hypothetical protein